MLLIEKSAVAGNALTGNAFIERVKDSGTIKKNDFKILRLKFFERMVDHNHDFDTGIQYFRKKNLEDVMKSNEVERLAFLFVDDGTKEALSVAAVGYGAHGIVSSAPMYKSGNKPEDDKLIPGPEFDTGIKRYEERMKNDELDFYPCRDKGIIHDLKITQDWLDLMQEDIKVYFGVEENELQNVMLRGKLKQSTANEIPMDDPDEDYAYDRGGGCCA